jgi:N-acetylmuramoyl-L-alanine amidase
MANINMTDFWKKAWLAVLLGVVLSGVAVAARYDTVVIDAGHGAHDRGAVSGYVFEKHIALDISRRLERFLKKKGVRTVMTRSNDRFIPLPTRAAMGSRMGRCVLVSVHANSATNRGASGMETFYYSNESLRLAQLVQRQMLRNTRHGGNRGVKHARFHVLRNCTRPAILVETAFLSNSMDLRRLRAPSYREAIAQSIGIGLLQYR